MLPLTFQSALKQQQTYILQVMEMKYLFREYVRYSDPVAIKSAECG